MPLATFTRERRDVLFRDREELKLGYGFQNHRRLEYHSPRPMCGAGDLCDVCEFVLHLMFWPAADDELRDGERPGCAGWIDCMLATQQCKFCQFLVKIFFDDCPDFPQDQIVCEENRRRFCCWVSAPNRVDSMIVNRQCHDQWYWKCDVTAQEVSDFDIKNETYIPYRTIQSAAGFSLDIRSKDVAIELYGPHHDDAALLSLAREVPRFWNAELSRSAFEICLARHGSKCDRPVSALSRYQHESAIIPSLGVNIRLVDVMDMKIACQPSQVTYAALSYCWIVGPYTRLVKDNLDAIQLPQSLTTRDLPPTIVDALAVTRALGLRYIWIDSLCIVQDDNNDKAGQLSQMDNVYRMASITIVAAGKTDGVNDAGLPGVRETSSRQSLGRVNLRGLTLQQYPSTIENVLYHSRWNSRAWTFQEYLLSKRLLLFSPVQVYFVCEQSIYAESFVDHICMNAKEVKEQSLAPCCDLTITDNQGDWRNADNPINYHNTYENLVRTYTQRQMRFHSDGLNAAMGLLNLLHKEHKVDFICGLPAEHLFGRFLLWSPTGRNCKRRMIDGKPAFPSWSWAGWESEAVYPPLAWPEDYDEDEFTSSGIQVENEFEVADWRVVLPSKSGNDSSEHYTPDELGVSICQLQDCSLSFTTEVSRAFQLEEQPFGAPNWFENEMPHSIAHTVKYDRKRAGAMILHGSAFGPTSADFWEMSSEGLELVLLSRAKRRWKMWYPLVEDDPTNERNHWYEPDEPDLLIYNPPFDEEEWDVLGMIVNVLLIKWDASVARRIGIGQVHADAWESAEKEWKQIILA